MAPAATDKLQSVGGGGGDGTDMASLDLEYESMHMTASNNKQPEPSSSALTTLWSVGSMDNNDSSSFNTFACTGGNTMDGSANALEDDEPVSFWETVWSLMPGQKQAAYKPPESLDNWSAAFILINFISVGYILNPSAFAQGGIILGTMGLAFVSLQSMITGVFVLEACARAEMMKVSMTVVHHTSVRRLRLAVLDISSRGNLGASSNHNNGSRRHLPSSPPSQRHLSSSPSSQRHLGGNSSHHNHTRRLDNNNSSHHYPHTRRTNDEETPTETTPIQQQRPPLQKRQSRRSSHRRYLPNRHSVRVHQRTFELSELCRIFLGRWMKNLFTLTTLGDLYGITWTFAAVFGSSLSEHLPMGFLGDNSEQWNYVAYIGIFMLVTVPASCGSITVQVPLQLTFLVGRTIMLGLMLGTLLAAYASDEPHFGTQTHAARETPLVNWSAIVTVLQTAVFSTAYQFSVPGLTGETGNKSAMVRIITKSVAYIYMTNLVLALLMATYFGDATQFSANLNWIDYHGGTAVYDGSGDMTSRAWWSTAISSYIVLFAALDGIAVYPLIAMSAGDIFMGAIYEDDVHEVQENWKIRTFFRLLASVPQAIGACFLKDLGVISKYAGVFTLLSYTICPSILAIQSRRFVVKAGLPSDTKYSIPLFSKDWVAYLLILLATALIFGVFVDAMLGLSEIVAENLVLDDDDDGLYSYYDDVVSSTTTAPLIDQQQEDLFN